MAKEAFNPRNSLLFLTIRVGKLLANEMRSHVKISEHGLQPHHMGVLVDLWTQDGVRQQDLALSTIKDKASITRALDAMEQANMVVRIPDASDKRIKRIYLTHLGRELQHELFPVAEEAVCKALGGTHEQDVEVCKKVLLRMYDNLHAGSRPAGENEPKS